VIFKGLAANASTHGHVYATLGVVKEHGIRPEDVAAVHVKCSVRVARHTTTPAKKYPRTAENADHSAYYATAHAIKYGGFGPDSIDPARFTDPVILDLIEKTTVEADPTLGKSQGISEIITKDGRSFQKRIEVPRGLGSDPFSDQELEDKFVEMAAKHMRKDHVRKLVDACWNVEKIDDIGKLAKLMVFEGVNN